MREGRILSELEELLGNKRIKYEQNTLNEFQQCQADLDQDGIINVVDIVLIVGYILGNV